MKALFSRRGLLHGLAGLPVGGGLFAAQAAPAVVVPGPHPDAALFEAEVALHAAEKAAEAALARSEAAHDAFRSAIGLCPSAIVLTAEEKGWLGGIMFYRTGFRKLRPRWAYASTGEDEAGMAQIWTADSLHIAILHAVESLGQGGRTPHRIRRWRELLPLAKAFDARWAEVEALHRTEDLVQLSRAASDARGKAERQFHRIMALTPEGLAVKVRHLDNFAWMGMAVPWIALFQSAAAVSGVALRGPKLDCERWASEFRSVGGRIQWNAAAEEGRFYWPVNHETSEAQRETLRRLLEEERSFGEELRFWLSQGGGA